MRNPSTGSQTQDDSRDQRVLIFLLGSLGDTLLALPALHLIRRTFPDAERRVLTHTSVSEKAASMASLLEGTGLVDGYFYFPARSKGSMRIRPLTALALDIRAWKPDLLVYLHEQRGKWIARRDGLLFKMLGLPRSIGVPYDTELQRVPADEMTGRFEHRSEYLARSLSSIGDLRLADRSSWDLCFSSEERFRAQSELKSMSQCAGTIAMSIGTKVDVNDWGDQNWRPMLAGLSAQLPGWGLVALGAPVERDRSSALLAAWRGPSLNLCGDLSVRESGALLERVRLFIGHDSGPMHLAATVGTPCVAVFSARNLPGRWYPYGESHRVFYHKTECFGCRLSACVEFKKKCILSISVSEVSDAVMSMLSTNTADALYQRCS
jgi:heptosyltransferase-3